MEQPLTPKEAHDLLLLTMLKNASPKETKDLEMAANLAVGLLGAYRQNSYL